jgi:hypothetical protein
MRLAFSPRSLVCSWACCLCLTLVGLQGPAGVVSAASVAGPNPTTIAASGPQQCPALWAGFLQGILGNRTRMIQTAIVAVALGIFILSRK